LPDGQITLRDFRLTLFAAALAVDPIRLRGKFDFAKRRNMFRAFKA
jgi:hypothetical protein